MRSPARQLLAAVVTVLASAVLLLTMLAHYAELADSAGFAGRAVKIVQAGPVQSIITNQISARVQAAGASSRSARPLIDQAVQQALSYGPVTAEIRAAAASLQSQLLSGQASSLALTLPSLGPEIASRIASSSPELAAEIERIGTITVVNARIPASAAQAVNDVAYLGRDATLLVVLTVALAVLALLLSPTRRHTLIGLGTGAAVSGLLAVAAYLGGRQVIINQFSSQAAGTAAGVVWNVCLGGLETLGLIVAAVGAAVTAAALPAGRPASRLSSKSPSVQ